MQETEETVLTSEEVMNAILATSCPCDALEDNWMLFQFELCDFTWEVVARCIEVPLLTVRGNDSETDLIFIFRYKYEVRSARLLPEKDL